MVDRSRNDRPASDRSNESTERPVDNGEREQHDSDWAGRTRAAAASRLSDSRSESCPSDGQRLPVLRERDELPSELAPSPSLLRCSADGNGTATRPEVALDQKLVSLGDVRDPVTLRASGVGASLLLTRDSLSVCEASSLQ